MLVSAPGVNIFISIQCSHLRVLLNIFPPSADTAIACITPKKKNYFGHALHLVI